MSKHFECAECGGTDGYRSRPRNFFEKYLLRLLGLQTARCLNCYQRSRVSRLIPLPERKSSVKRYAA